MARELPLKLSKSIQIGNYNIDDYGNTVKVVLDKNPINEKALDEIISRYNDKEIRIENIISVDKLNSLISYLSKSGTKSNILIDVLVNRDEENIADNNVIYGLENNKYINLEDVSENVKIKAFQTFNNQTEFTTWAHNLNSADKHTLLRVLCDEDKLRFIEQEKVIVDFYNTMRKNNSSIFSMSDKEKFNHIFDYMFKKYPYAGEALNTTGEGVLPNYKWSQDAIETYRRGRGVCEGRANLLTLVTNNSYMKLNCVTCDGKAGRVKHSWNQFIDNGVVTDYDLSYNIKDEPMTNMRKKYSRSYERVYPKVFTWLTGLYKKGSKKNTIKPLPKDER